MRERKRKIECIIILFLISGFFFNPLYENVNAKIIVNEPDEQLPSINNLGAPNYRYTDILIRNSIAYCNYYGFALNVFDFNDPKNPLTQEGLRLTYDYDSGFYEGQFDFYKEDFICFVNDENFTVIDISQPTNPTLNNTYQTGWNIIYLYDFKIVNDIGFVSCVTYYYYESERIFENSFIIFNMTNSVNNTIGSYHNKSGFFFDVSNDYAVLGTSINIDYYAREFDTHFEIIDISNKSNPFPVGTLNETYWPKSLEIVNDYLYITTYYSGLLIYDISEPTNPVKINEYTKIKNMRDIIFDGNLAFITYDKGLLILDLSDPYNIIKIGKKRIFFEGNGEFNKLVKEDDLIYALRSSEYSGREIYVFDVSNPSYPKKLFPLGTKIGHEVKYFLVMISLWVGIPAVLITAIVVPIVVVRKRKKKRKEEMKEQVKKIQQKPSEEETSEEFIEVDRTIVHKK